MAAFVKVSDFVEDICNGVHNLNTGTLTLALSNTAPASESPNPTGAGNGVLANVTQSSYTNLSARVLQNTSISISGSTASLNADTLVLTASGAVAEFRYVYLYNDSAGSDNLIAVWDYGSGVTLADTETFTATVSTTLFSIV